MLVHLDNIVVEHTQISGLELSDDKVLTTVVILNSGVTMKCILSMNEVYIRLLDATSRAPIKKLGKLPLDY